MGYLCEIQENPLALAVWNRWKHVYKLYMRDPRIECMPIITPAYPSMNCSANANKATREILLEEFSKAKKIVEETLSTKSIKPTKWYKILDPYIFFKFFKYFIVLEISSNNEKKIKILNGLIRSKIRNLVVEINLHAKVRLWPIGFQLRSDEYFKINHYLGIKRNKSNKTDKKIYIRSSHRFEKINFNEPIKKFKIQLFNYLSMTDVKIKVFKFSYVNILSIIKNPSLQIVIDFIDTDIFNIGSCSKVKKKDHL